MKNNKISLKNRIISGILSAAMFMNFSSFPAVITGEADDKTMDLYGKHLTWNDTEKVWETEQNTKNQDTTFGTYTFSAYWDPTQHTLDYEWNAYNNSQKFSNEAKIVFTFSSTDTSATWQGVADGADSTAITNANGDYSNASDVWFVLPGIASAKRDEPQEAIVGNSSRYFYCDGYDIERKLEDGSDNPYFDTAVYYLNNNTQKLNGGMEIVWDYNPRELTNGYGYTAESLALAENSDIDRTTLSSDNLLTWDESKALNPAVYVKVYKDDNGDAFGYQKGTGADGEILDSDGYLLDSNGNRIPDPIVVKVNLPTMHFGFLSEKDNVELQVNVEYDKESEEYKDSIAVEDSFDSTSIDKNFTWKRLSTNFNIYAKTRPLDNSDLYIEINAGDVENLFNKSEYIKKYNANGEIDKDGEEKGNVYLKVGETYYDLNTLETATDMYGNEVYRIPVDYHTLEKWSKVSDRSATDDQNYDYDSNTDFSVYLGVRNQTLEELVDAKKAEAYNTGNISSQTYEYNGTSYNIPSQATIDEMPDDVFADFILSLQAYFDIFDEGDYEFHHGPNGGAKIYLAKIAFPALAMGVSYNVRKNYWQFAAAMGMSF